jgi:hypothetical protein
MTRNDDESPQVEWLDAERPDAQDSGPNVPWRRWPRGCALAVATLTAIVVVSVVNHDRPTPTAAGGSHRHAVPRIAASGGSAPKVIADVGHHLLGVTADWELFARGPGYLLEIDLADGRITRTPVPALQTTGDVSFLVGTDQVIIRPWDLVPGYAVVDGQPARALPAALSHGGPAYPGPDPDQFWVQVGSAPAASMTLVGLDGRPTATSVPVPADRGEGQISRDGAGGLLYNAVGGSYEMRADGLHRVTTGAVLATGPARVLTAECDSHYRCASVLVNRTSGAHRVLARGALPYAPFAPGVISPNGSTAAMIGNGSDGTPTVHLLDLTTHADRALPIYVDGLFYEEDTTLVWSPDSRWLFVAAADGSLTAVEAHTGQVPYIGVAVPPINQLGIRAAG